MTTDRRAKKDTRSCMERTGEPYSVVCQATLNPDTSSFPDGYAFVDDHCANCTGPLPDDKEGLFCSSWCQETASTVRYLRRVFRDGRIEDADVQAAVQIRLAFLPVGGYAVLGRDLSPQTRQQVKDHADGLCQNCGRPGTDVDHIDGSSADPGNLQLLCKTCHQEKTEAGFVSLPPEITVPMNRLVLNRVMSDTPRLLADDETAWASKWRGLRNARRQRLLDQLHELGIDTWGLKGRAELICARDHFIAYRGDQGKTSSSTRTARSSSSRTATSPGRCAAAPEPADPQHDAADPQADCIPWPDPPPPS